MSIHQTGRAATKREHRVAIADSIENTITPDELRRQQIEAWFSQDYVEQQHEEWRRRAIIENVTGEDDEPMFATEQEHRQAIVDLGPLWPIELDTHAQTLTRLGLMP